MNGLLKGSNDIIIEKVRKVPGIGTRIEEKKNTNWIIEVWENHNPYAW